MNKILVLIIMVYIPFRATFSQVGIGTPTPDSSSQLDVSSNNKGFLPPRLALTATNIASPVTNPAIGLLVFNTATSGGSPINVSPGYYYWNGNAWYPVVNKGNGPGDMQYWNGSKWINIPLGLNGQNLTICNGIPVWGGCESIISISPSNNVYEGIISSNNANAPIATYDEFFLTGWTIGGVISNSRFLVKFDQAAIPFNAVIDNAKLYLYGDSTPIAGNMIDAHFGSTNAFLIQRITSSWTAVSTYTWNNPPATVTTNEVLVPQSISSFQDEIIDVTALVKDMQVNGNYSFLMKLQTEVTYNSRQYLSSFESNASKHPKLIISYH
ncbi:MAG: DNRLRE domain-containing protein [Ferruginibacter sp.]